MAKREIPKLKQRLSHCGLDMIENAEPVSWNTVARIGQFKIAHGHSYYWTVHGDLPVEHAQILYADPAGRDLIRVAGNCTCPPPESPWINYYDADGTEVITPKEWSSFEELSEGSHARNTLYDKAKRVYRVEQKPEDVARGYVTHYHIDGDLGLRVFVDLVKANLNFYEAILKFSCSACRMLHASKFAGATGSDITDLPVRCYSVINGHRCVGNILKRTS